MSTQALWASIANPKLTAKVLQFAKTIRIVLEGLSTPYGWTVFDTSKVAKLLAVHLLQA